MSTTWDVYCHQCKAYHGCYDVRDPALMLAIIRDRNALAALAPASKSLPNFELRIGYNYMVDPCFFLEHAGHRLVALSEYGEVIESQKELDDYMNPAIPRKIPS